MLMLQGSMGGIKKNSPYILLLLTPGSDDVLETKATQLPFSPIDATMSSYRRVGLWWRGSSHFLSVSDVMVTEGQGDRQSHGQSINQSMPA